MDDAGGPRQRSVSRVDAFDEWQNSVRQLTTAKPRHTGARSCGRWESTHPPSVWIDARPGPSPTTALPPPPPPRPSRGTRLARGFGDRVAEREGVMSCACCGGPKVIVECWDPETSCGPSVELVLVCPKGHGANTRPPGDAIRTQAELTLARPATRSPGGRRS